MSRNIPNKFKKTSLNHPQNITNTSPKHHQNITKTSPNHNQNIPKTSQNHNKNISKFMYVCPRRVTNLIPFTVFAAPAPNAQSKTFEPPHLFGVLALFPRLGTLQISFRINFYIVLSLGCLSTASFQRFLLIFERFALGVGGWGCKNCKGERLVALRGQKSDENQPANPRPHANFRKNVPEGLKSLGDHCKR